MLLAQGADFSVRFICNKCSSYYMIYWLNEYSAEKAPYFCPYCGEILQEKQIQAAEEILKNPGKS